MFITTRMPWSPSKDLSDWCRNSASRLSRRRYRPHRRSRPACGALGGAKQADPLAEPGPLDYTPRVPSASEPPSLEPVSSAAMDRVISAYQNGVDRSLLAENLRKTPEERVRALMALQRLAREARRAGEQLRGR